MATILVIEDDPYVRRFYARLFKFKNYEVEMAESGVSGIAKAKEMVPNLILLDILMPGMDGFAVLKELKADPVTKDCVVVVLTNLGDNQTVKKALSLGAGGFIIKANAPPEDLIKIVDSYLNAAPK